MSSKEDVFRLMRENATTQPEMPAVSGMVQAPVTRREGSRKETKAFESLRPPPPTQPSASLHKPTLVGVAATIPPPSIGGVTRARLRAYLGTFERVAFDLKPARGDLRNARVVPVKPGDETPIGMPLARALSLELKDSLGIKVPDAFIELLEAAVAWRNVAEAFDAFRREKLPLQEGAWARDALYTAVQIEAFLVCQDKQRESERFGFIVQLFKAGNPPFFGSRRQNLTYAFTA